MTKLVNNLGFIPITLLLVALGSCGGTSSDANALLPPADANTPFQIDVMPETYDLGGSAHGVLASVDQPQPQDSSRMELNINVDSARDLKSLYITINYDSRQYRLLDAQPTALMGDPGEMLSLFVPDGRGTADYGQVLINPGGQPGLTGSGVVAQFSFSRQPELADRQVSSPGPPMNIASQVTNLEFDGANLEWTYFQQGDYDQNGETNVADLTPIARHFSEVSPAGHGTPWPLTAVESQIDGDSNGEINAADITPISLGFLYNTLGGFNVFNSTDASDYPGGEPPTGTNGSGSTELTILPDGPILVSGAVNFDARDTERLTFLFEVSVPVADDNYWIRPANIVNNLGVASNLVNGNGGSAPVVSSTVPADSAEDVSLNVRPTATFSQEMNPATISETTFTLYEGATLVPGSVTYTGANATFRPDDVLSSNTVYTATISTGAENMAGVALASDYEWTFETGATLDTSAPTVISTDPEYGGGAQISVEPAATFSEAMDPETINETTFTLSQGLTAIQGSVDYLDLVAVFTPDDSLESDTEYTATITSGAQDLAGNPLDSDYEWTFRTAIVDLGASAPFGSFGGGSGMTNQGIYTVVNGDIGTTGASTMITGFHDSDGNVYTETPLNVGQVNGQVYTAPPLPGTAEQLAIATQGAIDAENAYDSLSPGQMPGGTDPGAGQLGGLTLEPGVYQAAGGTFMISGSDLTLDAQGDPNAVWVFQSASSLTVGDTSPRSVILINGAQARNVFWYVGSAATINAAGGGTMVGTIIASAGVTFSTAGNVILTVLNGRALGLDASVTLVNTIINIPE